MADTEEMADLEEWVGATFPQPYRAFLERQRECLPVGDLVLLYGRADLRERNEACQAKEYCPGYVTIGDDSGGQQILLPLSGGSLTLVDAGAMSPEWAHPLAEDFKPWLEAGCPLPEDEDGEL